jgi:hypothetical protein
MRSTFPDEIKKVKEGMIDEGKAQRREMLSIGREQEEIGRGAVCTARTEKGKGKSNG